MSAPLPKETRKKAVRECLVALEKMTPHTVIVEEISKKYSVTIQSGYKILATAYAEMHEQDRPLVGYRKARNRRAMERVAFHAIEMAQGTGQSTWATVAINAFDKLAKLDGLYEPEKVEVSDKRKRPEDMSRAERQKEIARLLQQRADAGIADPRDKEESN